MLIPKKNRKTIYEHLFKEGVLVAKKDFFAPKHAEIETVPNLQVIKAMQVRDRRPCALFGVMCRSLGSHVVFCCVVFEVTWLREGAVQLAVLLLVPDQ